MESTNIKLRIHQIKFEIFELVAQSNSKLVSRIDILRLINSLLKEQNKLLRLKNTQITRTALLKAS